MGNDWDETPSGAQVANVVFALLVHVLLGLPLVGLATGLASLAGETVAVVWGLSGLALWAAGAVNALGRHRDLGATWGAVARSWLWSLLGPIALTGLGLGFLTRWAASDEPAPPLEPLEEPVNPALARRLDEVERRLRELGREVAEIRRLAETGEAEVATPVAPQPPPPEPVTWEPRQPPAPAPEAEREPPRPARPAPPPREPSVWDREVDFGEVLGAKGLAWAGGVVTVLGVVFFFVLAVNRGWIGPVERVGLGALASALVFGSGLFLHRRYGSVYSAYGAVGAGLAGGYATLVAAAALYGLVSDLAALGVAAGIAAVGVATSLYWSSELVAGIGLVGATLVPLMVLFEEDISPLGTGFAGLVFTATAVVAVYKRWPSLLGAGFVASAPQIALLVGDGEVTDWDRVILAWIFAGLYVGAAAALHWALDEDGLHSLSASFVMAAAVLAGATGGVLFEGDDRGWIAVGAGVAFGVVAAALFPRVRDRDLSALLAVAGLALVAVGLGVVLSGPGLALAWAAEAAVLAWLAHRIDEPRYQLAALAYLGGATVHAIALDAPPRDLYEAVGDPASGALAPLGVAIAAAVVAVYSRPWPEDAPASGFFRLLEPVLAPFRDRYAVWRAVAAWLAGAAALYAASLGLLELSQLVWAEDLSAEFELGHVAVTALWGAAAAALSYATRWFDSPHVRAAGLALAAATFVQAVTFDMTLETERRGWALLAAGVALLLTAFAEELPAPEGRGLSPWALLLTLTSAGLGTVGLYFAVGGSIGLVDAEGVAWLGLAVVYAVLAALVFRIDRDFSTVLWAPALTVGALAAAELVSDTWLVLAWTGVGAAVCVLGDRIDEQRLQAGAAGYLALALGYTLVELAPPNEFFRANEDPAVGVPALVFTVAALTVFAVYGMASERTAPYRLYGVSLTAVLGIYAVSLAILGAFQWLGTASVETDFQRGHSAVSAFWGIVGLLTLYAGLTRDLRALRVAGFALFGLALAKLFLYDLANLSSITRALSFLAVGAVLLLAGFFYQRLTATTREA
jgi:uncharacterized membrane protein